MEPMDDCEHAYYAINFEEQEEWDGPGEYDPERDGELEWCGMQWRRMAEDDEDEEDIAAELEDCIEYAKKYAQCEGMRNVHVVEGVYVEREVFRP